MKQNGKNEKIRFLLPLAAAVSALSASADEIDDLINPNTAQAAVTLLKPDGVGPLYRQYSGMDESGPHGNLDLNIVRRDADGGWFKLWGENLGLSTQEFGVSYDQQGAWSIGLDYNQIVRYTPYEVGTAISGVGSDHVTQPSYPNSAFSDGALTNPSLYDVSLKTERAITTLTASRFLSAAMKLGFSFKYEDKTGTRLDGVRGVAGSAGTPITGTANRYSGFLFAPEPINQNHTQLEGSLEYAADRYQWSAGYYGSFLRTKYDALYVAGGTNTQAVTVGPSGLSPIALAPDNSFLQIYVNGGYNFSSDTRGTLKLAYSQGRQNDAFIERADVLPGVGDSLDARLDTKEVYASLSSRVTRDLKLLATWRLEDKNDRTPVRLTATGVYNNPESHLAKWAKLEADYNLGAGYGLTAGLDQSGKRSQQWERKAVDETTLSMALRKSMNEALNGVLALSSSQRSGSDWEGAPLIYPVYLADRRRDKLRGMLDWSPSERLNLQLGLEQYQDDYGKSAYGLDSGRGSIYSLDASYAVTDDWRLNAWYSRQNGTSRQYMRGAVCSTNNDSNCTSNTPRASGTTDLLIDWDATLQLNTDQFGLGAQGKVGQADVGAQYLYARDFNRQRSSPLPAATATSNTPPYGISEVADGNGVLPDTTYRQQTLRLFASYPLKKATRLRCDYIHDVRRMDDYTWKQWVYADGTRVFAQPNQTTRILGLTLIQSF